MTTNDGLSCENWAEKIGQATFNEDQAGRVVYLAIDQEEIQRIGLDVFGLDDESTAYESFRKAVIKEVACDWPAANIPWTGKYPIQLALLAAQVVAAFQMHDDGKTGIKAYWRRLRQFLGQDPEDTAPKGLIGEDHTALWANLKKWANETNGGGLGLVKLVEKDRGHRLVAEPLGQCLLRRGDLDKLYDLFTEKKPQVPEPARGWRLKEFVDEARRSWPAKYFTKHSHRVFDDDRRSVAAGCDGAQLWRVHDLLAHHAG